MNVLKCAAYPYNTVNGKDFLVRKFGLCFGFTGIEKNNEIKGAGNSYSTEFRELDPRIVTWWSVDPLTAKYPSHSPYNYTEGNPIVLTDRTGKGSTSTHTDKDGNVVAVKNDGDKGVYKHDGEMKTALADVNKNYSKNNTGAGGTKMGETWTALSFADFDAYNGTEASIKIASGTKIDFNSNWATEEVNSILNENPSIFGYFNKAERRGDWDIKNNAEKEGKGLYYGSKLFDKFASARDAGNFAAGAVAQKSILPNLIFNYGYGLYNQANNNKPLTALIGATDLITGLTNPTAGIGIFIYRANLGENRLSSEGRVAGESFIRGLKK